jgi:HEPN domain-containing protein
MTTHSQAWLESAKSDLAVIREIIEKDELTNMVAFHAEQAIEKSFKAILEEKEKIVPKIHDLITLNEKVKMYIKLQFDEEIMKQINEVYVDTRYPSDAGLLPSGKPSKGKAANMKQFAENIYKQVKKYLE